MGSLHRQNTLSKQTSAVFNMTLDELQASMGSGKAFGSMNMVRLQIAPRAFGTSAFGSYVTTVTLAAGRVPSDGVGQRPGPADHTAFHGADVCWGPVSSSKPGQVKFRPVN